MSAFRPKYISFDCYGTLTNFQMAQMARKLFPARVAPAEMEGFVESFRGYRLDEVLGDWKPYKEVVRNAVERTCKRWNIEFREADGEEIYEAVPTWDPHPDVTEPLTRVGAEIPLVILSNADNSQIHQNVKRLGAPFAHVFTAEDANAYKPRLQAFEYMLDQLGCGPEDCMHVSSSFRYDQMSAYDLGFGARVFVARGHEPELPRYATHVIKDIGGLPAVVGL